MEVNGYRFMVDQATRFFNSVYVFGWFYHPKDRLSKVGALLNGTILDLVGHIDLPHGGVSNLGDRLGFSLQLMLKEQPDVDSIILRFNTVKGEKITISLADLVKDRDSENPAKTLAHQFLSMVSESPRVERILDIGGRERTRGILNREYFNQKVDVLDVMPDQSVDIVGDVHECSNLCSSQYYDAFYSISVFEHLLMPWKAAVEINKVMKIGALGYVQTHQTLGMHDLPWDFWRFSDSAWDAVFNSYTGYEIIGRSLADETFIIPFRYSERWVDAEKSAGFATSAVLVKKISEPRVDWQISLNDIIKTHYPEEADNSIGKSIFADAK